MTTTEIIQLRAPDLYADNTDRLPDLISLAQEQTSVSFYGTKYDTAVALLVLHWLTLEERGGVGGSVQSEKEGQLSRSYQVQNDGSSAYFSQTSWGIELSNLRKTRAMFPRTRMM